MDISDEELFDATPSTSTNTSLNLTEQAKDVTQDIQEKDCNSILTKDILVKLTRLPNAKEKKKQSNLHSFKNKRRKAMWKYGLLKNKHLCKRGKSVPSSKFSESQQAFQNMEPTTEAILIPSTPADRTNEQIDTHSYNQLHKVGESCEDAQQSEQTAQSETKNFILSTCEIQDEDLCVNKTYACARTLPYKFYRKGIVPSNTSAVEYSDSLSLLSSSSKNTESSLHSEKSHLSDHSASNAKTMKKLFHSRLKFMAKRMGKQLNEWKFKRKYVSSDSETEEQLVPKKRRRRISSNESNEESANNMEVIGDNNRSEFHLEKINEKKTSTLINCKAQVVLTRLEEMKDEDVIKWRESKTKPSDIIASESIENQLDRRKLSRNLIESQDRLTLSKENRFLETENIPEDPPLTNSCIEKHSVKSKLNKLRKRYNLFKKPRVLMIKLDTLQCFSKYGRYSAIEIDRLTKKYVNFVINSNFQNKTHGLKMYKHVRLQKKSTMNASTICTEDRSTSPSLSKRQNENASFKPCLTESTEESSTKGKIFFKINLFNFIFYNFIFYI